MIITKLGAHINSGPRNGFGRIDRHLAGAVSLEAGAFDSMPAGALKIWRTQAIQFHEDAPGDIDSMTEAESYAAAFYWGPKLWALFQPVHERYPGAYLKPCNETGGSNLTTLRNLSAYFRGLVDYFTPLGVRLALWGCAGGDPDYLIWKQHIAPSLRYAYEANGGHIYTRNAYGGVPGHLPLSLTDASGIPQTDNAMRPFLEARYMLRTGLHMPIVIGEAGQAGGADAVGRVGVSEIVRDHIAYDAYASRPEHCLIVASCVWVYGKWNDSNEHNIQEASDDLGSYLETTERPYGLADLAAHLAAYSAENDTEPPQVGTQQMTIEERRAAHAAILGNYSLLAKTAAANGYAPDMSSGERPIAIAGKPHTAIPAHGNGGSAIAAHPIDAADQAWQAERVTIILQDGSEGNPLHANYPAGTDPKA